MNQKEILDKITELRQLQALIAEAEQEAEAIRDAVKAYMGDAQELHAGEYKVTWRPVETARLDCAALRKALPDVVQRFTRTTTSRRFCVA